MTRPLAQSYGMSHGIGSITAMETRIYGTLANRDNHTRGFFCSAANNFEAKERKKHTQMHKYFDASTNRTEVTFQHIRDALQCNAMQSTQLIFRTPKIIP